MTQKQIRGLWLTSRLRAVPFRMFSWMVTVASAVVSWFMYALHGRLLPLLLSSGLAMVVSVLMVEDYRTFLDVRPTASSHRSGSPRQPRHKKANPSRHLPTSSLIPPSFLSAQLLETLPSREQRLLRSTNRLRSLLQSLVKSLRSLFDVCVELKSQLEESCGSLFVACFHYLLLLFSCVCANVVQPLHKSRTMTTQTSDKE